MHRLFTFARVIADDLIRRQSTVSATEQHRLAAQAWLQRAHDRGTDRGVSYGFSLRNGWGASYPETSGYIATTFFDLADKHDLQGYRRRAVEICDWLIDVQNADGSFANPRYGADGIVFDTGQDLLGLVRAFDETGDARFAAAAGRAADWLVAISDDNDVWTRNEHLGVPHVYNARTAWALLLARPFTDAAAAERVARANLDWAVAEQQPSGFFDNCAFERGARPFTHTLAYTARGLLESALVLPDDRYLTAARRCADAAIESMDGRGFLPGEFAIDGSTSARYCCLTGNCQFAIIWGRLYQHTRDPRYRDAVIRATDYVVSHQDISTPNANVHGAIKGSHPIWGRYAPMSYPNWPAKFLVDSLLLRQSLDA